MRNFIMRNLTFYSAFFCMYAASLFSQSPGWVLQNPGAYSYTASVISVMKLDGINSDNPNDRIAFFVGNELRGVGTPVSIGNGNYVHFVSVYSNAASELMNIKIYHAATNSVYEAQTTLLFQLQAVFGSLNAPFVVEAFTENDAPLSILNIADQLTIEGLAFNPLDLDLYLIQPDPNPVLWSASPNPDLMVSFQGSVLSVQGIAGFSGTSTLTIRATEQTVNQNYAETDIIFQISDGYAFPSWQTIPGEGIVLGGSFTPFDLDDYEYQYGGVCIEYDYTPVIIASVPADPRPDWEVLNNFPTNMTAIASLIYTQKYIFHHPDDILAAFIGNEIRGVANPVNVNGTNIFFLTIGGGSSVEPVTIRFYSGALKRVMTWNKPLSYVPNRIEGSVDYPFKMNFSPLEPVIGFGGTTNILINDSLWTGQQSFLFIAKDCNYPLWMNASSEATFCITSQSSALNYYYRDLDGDGFGDPNVFVQSCSQRPGYVTNNTDCNDNNDQLVGLEVNIEVIENSGILPDDGNICTEAPVQITATGGNQFLWNTGSNSDILELNPLITTSYTVTVTNGTGCIGSRTQIINVEGTVVLNQNNIGPGSLRNVLECITEGGTISYDQPINNTTILTSPLTITKNVSINGLGINLRPVIGIDFNLSSSGFNILQNKTLTLRNVDLKLMNAQDHNMLTGMGNLNIGHFTKIVKE